MRVCISGNSIITSTGPTEEEGGRRGERSHQTRERVDGRVVPKKKKEKQERRPLLGEARSDGSISNNHVLRI